MHRKPNAIARRTMLTAIDPTRREAASKLSALPVHKNAVASASSWPRRCGVIQSAGVSRMCRECRSQNAECRTKTIGVFVLHSAFRLPHFLSRRRDLRLLGDRRQARGVVAGLVLERQP